MPEGSFIKGKLLLMHITSPTKYHIYSISFLFYALVLAAVLGLMCPARAFAATSENASSSYAGVTATAGAVSKAETSEEDSTKTTSSAEGIASSNANSASSVSQSSTTAADTASSAESSEAATTTNQEVDSGEASDTTNNEGSGDDSAAGADDSIAANDNSETSSDAETNATPSEGTATVIDTDNSIDSLASNQSGATDVLQEESESSTLSPVAASVNVSSLLRTSSELTSLDGIDISGWDPDIDLSKVDADFVIVKATEGDSYTSPTFIRQANQTLDLGKELGLYHFAVSTCSATAQATYFVNKIKDYLGKAVLFLDWENTDYSDVVSLGPSFARTWLDTVYNLTGVQPLIYMSMSTAQSADWSDVAKNYQLWVAQYLYRYDNDWLSDPVNASNAENWYGYTSYSGYAESPVQSSTLAGEWKNTSGITIYQYSSTGELSGYNRHLDLDKFYGTRSDWEKLASLTSAYRDGVNYSAVYDYTYYVDNYSDLYARYGANNDKYGALTHFITFGMSEARQASASFNVKVYKECYSDLQKAFGNNWKAYYIHFIIRGQYEHRRCV